MFMRPLFYAFFLLLTFSACQKDENTTPVPSDPNLITGAFSATHSGVFQAQNGYRAEGTAEIGMDGANAQWLRLAPDFNTTLSTGGVTVYLSQNKSLNLGAAGTFRRLAVVTVPGEHFYKIDPAVGIDFKFAILWCASASVPFGNAELK